MKSAVLVFKYKDAVVGLASLPSVVVSFLILTATSPLALVFCTTKRSAGESSPIPTSPADVMRSLSSEVPDIPALLVSNTRALLTLVSVGSASTIAPILAALQIVVSSPG